MMDKNRYFQVLLKVSEIICLSKSITDSQIQNGQPIFLEFLTGKVYARVWILTSSAKIDFMASTYLNIENIFMGYHHEIISGNLQKRENHPTFFD